MADEQQPAPSQEPSFVDKLKMDGKTLWNEHKLFFIIFGVLILIVKFRDILIDILLNSAKSVEENAKKQDAKLASEESQANSEANKLIEQAKQEPSKEQPVDDDWYKKK